MRKRTKIIATISDKNCSPELIKEMFDNGMNAVRLNTAHQNFEGSKKVIENVRKVSDKIAIIIDTKGPEIRTVALEKSINLKTGDSINIKGWNGETSDNNCVYVTYPDFVKEISINDRLLIDDGELELVVSSKTETCLVCKATNDGVIQDHKSVNVPGVSIDLPALTPKDIDYINFAIENDVDFIAHSFVRKKEDVIAVKSLLESQGSKIKIIAKIENQEGVNNIDEILKYAYGIMVARGDLALEIPAQKYRAFKK
jgi:pyruvate kinase